MSARPETGRPFSQALRSAQQQLAGRLEGLAGAGPREVHATRVAARRLRSLLKTFEPLLAAAAARRYRADLKRVADALAEQRETDVIAALEPLRGEPFATALARERRDGERRLRRRLLQPGTARALERLRRPPSLAQLGLARDPPQAELLRRVRKAWRRVARAAERDDASLAARHQLRIRLKHCRYSLEIVAETEPGHAARLSRRLRAAQQLLGEERDLAAAQDWLRRPHQKLPRTPRLQAERRLQRTSREVEREIPQLMERLQRDGARWDAAASRVMRLARPDPVPR